MEQKYSFKIKQTQLMELGKNKNTIYWTYVSWILTLNWSVHTSTDFQNPNCMQL